MFPIRGVCRDGFSLACDLGSIKPRQYLQEAGLIVVGNLKFTDTTKCLETLMNKEYGVVLVTDSLQAITRWVGDDYRVKRELFVPSDMTNNLDIEGGGYYQKVFLTIS